MKMLCHMRLARIYAVVFLCSLALSLGGCNEASEDQSDKADLVRPVKVTTVITAKNSSIKTFPGVTEATRKSTLAFRVSGLVEDLSVKAGQVVKTGDTIARLDQTPYRNIVNDREAKHDLAQAKFNRQKELLQKEITAQASLDEAEASLKASRVALDIAEDDLRFTKLVSPYDGIIAKVHIDNHQNVKANEPIVELQGNRNIDILFNVPEAIFIAGDTRKADLVLFHVRFNSQPKRVFKAHYRKHDSIPDEATRSYKVVVGMPLPNNLTVLPGMSVTVEVDLSDIYAHTPDSDVLIPIEAVFEEAGKTFVWGLDDNNVCHKTAVTMERIEGVLVRISQGLAPGQRIVSTGVSHIYEGLTVRPLSRERGL